jgi:integrase
MGRKRRGRGEGSLYQEVDGRWCAAISFGIDSRGKRRRRKVRGKTKADVLKRIAELQGTGPGPVGAALTVGQFLQAWLTDLRAREVIGDTSYCRYEHLIRLHVLPFWALVRLRDVRKATGYEFVQALRAGGAGVPTQRLALRILKAVLNTAVERELLAANPLAHLKQPRHHDKEVPILDPEQATRLLDVARAHALYPLFAVALGTGLRIGELLGLHWPDVDLEEGVVEVKHTVVRVHGRLVLKTPKTKAARRRVRLPQQAWAALRDHHARQEAAGRLDVAVFCNRAGRLHHAGLIGYRILRRLLKQAGLAPVKFHALRHTHASILLSRGASLRAVATRLGHRDPSITLRVYAHVLPNDDRELVKVLDDFFC